ncbi:MAG: HAD hydrolase-like protein, partial [Eubacterium sp.]|nr:HAD hydrolase-like protein [Candidatus Colimonas fimequi]
ALRGAGIPITIASSTDKYQIDVAMERLDMAKYIDRVYSVSDVGVNKSNPLIFNIASEFMGTKPEETWVFEDGLYAIKCAKAAGYKTIGFYDEVSDKDWAEIQATADIAVENCSHITVEEIQNYGE